MRDKIRIRKYTDNRVYVFRPEIEKAQHLMIEDHISEWYEAITIGNENPNWIKRILGFLLKKTEDDKSDG